MKVGFIGLGNMGQAISGRIIDADGLRMQLEGAFLQAASWTLKEQVTFDRDGITSRDWDTYPILRFDEVPDVDTVLIDRPDEPSLGAGEAATGPTAGAIANAVFDATGLRLRVMPFTPDQVRAAAAGFDPCATWRNTHFLFQRVAQSDRARFLSNVAGAGELFQLFPPIRRNVTQLQRPGPGLA